jgi:hypothetical protein
LVVGRISNSDCSPPPLAAASIQAVTPTSRLIRTASRAAFSIIAFEGLGNWLRTRSQPVSLR